MITVIDLLNKIANGEEVPKKIRIEGWCYKFEWKDFAGNYIDESENIDLMSALSCDEEELNREIKIIEEDKKIEKLDIKQEKNIKNNWKWKLNNYCISTPQKIMAKKINELIDEINNLKEK